MLKIEVISNREVSTANGLRYVHNISIRTPEKMLNLEQWESKPISPGEYMADEHYFQTNNGKSVGLGLRNLKPAK